MSTIETARKELATLEAAGQGNSAAAIQLQAAIQVMEGKGIKPVVRSHVALPPGVPLRGSRVAAENPAESRTATGVLGLLPPPRYLQLSGAVICIEGLLSVARDIISPEKRMVVKWHHTETTIQVAGTSIDEQKKNLEVDLLKIQHALGAVELKQNEPPHDGGAGQPATPPPAGPPPRPNVPTDAEATAAANSR